MKCNLPKYNVFEDESLRSFFKNANPIEIQDKIRSFRKLDFEHIEDSDLYKEIYKVLSINGQFCYPLLFHKILKGQLFFRVRKLFLICGNRQKRKLKKWVG